MQYEEPIHTFLQVVLALNAAVGEQKGLEPLLSTRTYDYGIEPPSWDWREIGRQIDGVRSQLDDLPAARAPFLTDLLDAFALMAREGQGETIPYAVRVSTFLQVPGERVRQDVIDGLKADLQRLFVQASYPDDFGVALDRWREAQRVSGPDVTRNGHAFLERARSQTKKRIWSLPPGHEVVLTFPKNYPYRGHSDYSKDYRGSVCLNGDVEWQLATLKHVRTRSATRSTQKSSSRSSTRRRPSRCSTRSQPWLARAMSRACTSTRPRPSGQ